MLLRLLLLFTVIPIVELILLVQIGRLTGVAFTLALVLGTGVLGAVLTRLEGLRVLRRVREDLDRGRLPAGALVDGLLILVAGAVLLTPGLITDAAGFLLLLPPTRSVARRAVNEALRRRVTGRGGTAVLDAEWTREEVPSSRPDGQNEEAAG